MDLKRECISRLGFLDNKKKITRAQPSASCLQVAHCFICCNTHLLNTSKKCLKRKNRPYLSPTGRLDGASRWWMMDGEHCIYKRDQYRPIHVRNPFRYFDSRCWYICLSQCQRKVLILNAKSIEETQRFTPILKLLRTTASSSGRKACTRQPKYSSLSITIMWESYINAPQL